MNDNNYISDKLLSAFLDGNTSAEETMQVLKAAQDDEQLRDTIGILQDLEETFCYGEPKGKDLPMMSLAAKRKDSYLCDIECEEFVLHQFGIETTHKSLLDEAYRNCWLKDKGMPLYNIGRLLEKNNLSVSRRYDSTIDDVVRLLDMGNQLIAVIDNALLDAVQDADDTQQLPNHAVAISSVCVAHNEIVLYNPNTEEQLTTYNLATFCQAWKKSNNYLVVVNTTDKFKYEPYPINLDDVTLSDDLTELQEAIAENAHEIWAQARAEQGWTYGPERNDQKKENPDMVAYCNLPESEKLYDREMAMQTLKLVKKLGFDIVRKKQPDGDK